MDKYGFKCTFIDHDLKSMLLLPVTQRPRIFVDTEDKDYALRNVFVRKPNGLYLCMNNYGFYAFDPEVRHGDVVVKIRRAKNALPGAGWMLDLRLPVAISDVVSGYEWQSQLPFFRTAG